MSGRFGFADVVREGDTSSLEQRADDAGCGRAQGDLAPIIVDLDFLQPIEVAQHVAPLRPEGRLSAALIQFLAKDEGEKRTEDMAADGGI